MNMEKGFTSFEYKKQFEHHIFLRPILIKKGRVIENSGCLIKVVLCFDMENVIQLPRANLSNFFYKRKLSFFNYTIHSSIGNKVYCCVWSEYTGGRNANCVASA